MGNTMTELNGVACHVGGITLCYGFYIFLYVTLIFYLLILELHCHSLA